MSFTDLALLVLYSWNKGKSLKFFNIESWIWKRKIRKRRRMKSIKESATKKRARDLNHSEATKTERAKSERKLKHELKHSSLQNQYWSWRLEYYSFLFWRTYHIILNEKQKTIIFKSPTPILVLETWMLEFVFQFSFALGSFCLSGFGMIEISCSLLCGAFFYALHPSSFSYFSSPYSTFNIKKFKWWLGRYQ